VLEIVGLGTCGEDSNAAMFVVPKTSAADSIWSNVCGGGGRVLSAACELPSSFLGGMPGSSGSSGLGEAMLLQVVLLEGYLKKLGHVSPSLCSPLDRALSPALQDESCCNRAGIEKHTKLTATDGYPKVSCQEMR